MFDKFVAGLLTSYLGDYFEDIDTEQVKVSVWKGDVVLRQLRVRQDALRFWDIPLCVSHGVIGELRVKIPWTKLSSESIVIVLDGVELVLEQHAAVGYDAAKLRAEALERKLRELATTEEAALSERAEAAKRQRDSAQAARAAGVGTVDEHAGDDGDSEDAKKSTTFSARLKANILNNVRLEVTNLNLHLREAARDDATEPATSTGPSPASACSLTLVVSSVKAYSCNDQYIPAFSSVKRKLLYKSLDVRGCQVLVDGTPPSAVGGTYSADGRASSSGPSTVVEPFDAFAKLQYQPVPFLRSIPTYLLTFRVEEVVTQLDDQQWAFLAVLMRQAALGSSQMHLYSKYHPSTAEGRPSRSPAAWWRYAINAVLDQERAKRQRARSLGAGGACTGHGRGFSWKAYQFMKVKRASYTQLYLRSMRSTLHATDWTAPLTEEEQEELHALECALPLVTLQTARLAAMQHADMEREHFERAARQKRTEREQQMAAAAQASPTSATASTSASPSSPLREQGRPAASTRSWLSRWWTGKSAGSSQSSSHGAGGVGDGAPRSVFADLSPADRADVQEAVSLMTAAQWSQMQRVAIAKEFGLSAEEAQELSDTPVSSPRAADAVGERRVAESAPEPAEGSKEMSVTGATEGSEAARTTSPLSSPTLADSPSAWCKCLFQFTSSTVRLLETTTSSSSSSSSTCSPAPATPIAVLQMAGLSCGLVLSSGSSQAESWVSVQGYSVETGGALPVITRRDVARHADASDSVSSAISPSGSNGALSPRRVRESLNTMLSDVLQVASTSFRGLGKTVATTSTFFASLRASATEVATSAAAARAYSPDLPTASADGVAVAADASLQRLPWEVALTLAPLDVWIRLPFLERLARFFIAPAAKWAESGVDEAAAVWRAASPQVSQNRAGCVEAAGDNALPVDKSPTASTLPSAHVAHKELLLPPPIQLKPAEARDLADANARLQSLQKYVEAMWLVHWKLTAHDAALHVPADSTLLASSETPATLPSTADPDCTHRCSRSVPSVSIGFHELVVSNDPQRLLLRRARAAAAARPNPSFVVSHAQPAFGDSDDDWLDYTHLRVVGLRVGSETAGRVTAAAPGDAAAAGSSPDRVSAVSSSLPNEAGAGGRRQSTSTFAAPLRGEEGAASDGSKGGDNELLQRATLTCTATRSLLPRHQTRFPVFAMHADADTPVRLSCSRTELFHYRDALSALLDFFHRLHRECALVKQRVVQLQLPAGSVPQPLASASRRFLLRVHSVSPAYVPVDSLADNDAREEVSAQRLYYSKHAFHAWERDERVQDAQQRVVEVKAGSLVVYHEHYSTQPAVFYELRKGLYHVHVNDKTAEVKLFVESGGAPHAQARKGYTAAKTYLLQTLGLPRAALMNMELLTRHVEALIADDAQGSSNGNLESDEKAEDAKKLKDALTVLQRASHSVPCHCLHVSCSSACELKSFIASLSECATEFALYSPPEEVLNDFRELVPELLRPLELLRLSLSASQLTAVLKEEAPAGDASAATAVSTPLQTIQPVARLKHHSLHLEACKLEFIHRHQSSVYACAVQSFTVDADADVLVSKEGAVKSSEVAKSFPAVVRLSNPPHTPDGDRPPPAPITLRAELTARPSPLPSTKAITVVGDSATLEVNASTALLNAVEHLWDCIGTLTGSLYGSSICPCTPWLAPEALIDARALSSADRLWRTHPSSGAMCTASAAVRVAQLQAALWYPSDGYELSEEAAGGLRAMEARAEDGACEPAVVLRGTRAVLSWSKSSSEHTTTFRADRACADALVLPSLYGQSAREQLPQTIRVLQPLSSSASTSVPSLSVEFKSIAPPPTLSHADYLRVASAREDGRCLGVAFSQHLTATVADAELLYWYPLLQSLLEVGSRGLITRAATIVLRPPFFPSDAVQDPAKESQQAAPQFLRPWPREDEPGAPFLWSIMETTVSLQNVGLRLPVSLEELAQLSSPSLSGDAQASLLRTGLVLAATGIRLTTTLDENTTGVEECSVRVPEKRMKLVCGDGKLTRMGSQSGEATDGVGESSALLWEHMDFSLTAHSPLFIPPGRQGSHVRGQLTEIVLTHATSSPSPSVLVRGNVADFDSILRCQFANYQQYKAVPAYVSPSPLQTESNPFLMSTDRPPATGERVAAHRWAVVVPSRLTLCMEQALDGHEDAQRADVQNGTEAAVEADSSDCTAGTRRVGLPSTERVCLSLGNARAELCWFTNGDFDSRYTVEQVAATDLTLLGAGAAITSTAILDAALQPVASVGGVDGDANVIFQFSGSEHTAPNASTLDSVAPAAAPAPAADSRAVSHTPATAPALTLSFGWESHAPDCDSDRKEDQVNRRRLHCVCAAGAVMVTLLPRRLRNFRDTFLCLQLRNAVGLLLGWAPHSVPTCFPSMQKSSDAMPPDVHPQQQTSAEYSVTLQRCRFALPDVQSTQESGCLEVVPLFELVVAGVRAEINDGSGAQAGEVTTGVAATRLSVSVARMERAGVFLPSNGDESSTVESSTGSTHTFSPLLVCAEPPAVVTAASTDVPARTSAKANATETPRATDLLDEIFADLTAQSPAQSATVASGSASSSPPPPLPPSPVSSPKMTQQRPLSSGEQASDWFCLRTSGHGDVEAVLQSMYVLLPTLQVTQRFTELWSEGGFVKLPTLLRFREERDLPQQESNEASSPNITEAASQGLDKRSMRLIIRRPSVILREQAGGVSTTVDFTRGLLLSLTDDIVATREQQTVEEPASPSGTPSADGRVGGKWTSSIVLSGVYLCPCAHQEDHFIAPFTVSCVVEEDTASAAKTVTASVGTLGIRLEQRYYEMMLRRFVKHLCTPPAAPSEKEASEDKTMIRAGRAVSSYSSIKLAGVCVDTLTHYLYRIDDSDDEESDSAVLLSSPDGGPEAAASVIAGLPVPKWKFRQCLATRSPTAVTHELKASVRLDGFALEVQQGPLRMRLTAGAASLSTHQQANLIEMDALQSPSGSPHSASAAPVSAPAEGNGRFSDERRRFRVEDHTDAKVHLPAVTLGLSEHAPLLSLTNGSIDKIADTVNSANTSAGGGTLTFTRRNLEDLVTCTLGHLSVNVDTSVIVSAVYMLYKPFAEIVLPQYRMEDVRVFDRDTILSEDLCLTRRTKVRVSNKRYNRVTINAAGHAVHFMDADDDAVLFLDEGLTLYFVNASIHLHGKGLDFYTQVGNGSYVVMDQSVNTITPFEPGEAAPAGGHDVDVELSEESKRRLTGEGTHTLQMPVASPSPGTRPPPPPVRVGVAYAAEASGYVRKVVCSGQLFLRLPSSAPPGLTHNEGRGSGAVPVGSGPLGATMVLSTAVQACLVEHHSSCPAPPQLYHVSNMQRSVLVSLPAFSLQGSRTGTLDLNELKLESLPQSRSSHAVRSTELLSRWSLRALYAEDVEADRSSPKTEKSNVDEDTGASERVSSASASQLLAPGGGAPAAALRKIEVTAPTGVEVQLRYSDLLQCMRSFEQVTRALAFATGNVDTGAFTALFQRRRKQPGATARDTAERVLKGVENLHRQWSPAAKYPSLLGVSTAARERQAAGAAPLAAPVTTTLTLSIPYINIRATNDNEEHSLNEPLFQLRLESLRVPLAVHHGLKSKFQVEYKVMVEFYDMASSCWTAFLERTDMTVLWRSRLNATTEDIQQRRGSYKASMRIGDARVYVTPALLRCTRRLLQLQRRLASVQHQWSGAAAAASGTSTAENDANAKSPSPGPVMEKYCAFRIVQNAGNLLLGVGFLNDYVDHEQGPATADADPASAGDAAVTAARAKGDKGVEVFGGQALGYLEQFAFNFPTVSGRELASSQQCVAIFFDGDAEGAQRQPSPHSTAGAPPHQTSPTERQRRVTHCEVAVLNVSCCGRFSVPVGPTLLRNHLIADVQVENGQKVITLRTNLLLVNELPWGVELLAPYLVSSSSPHDNASSDAVGGSPTSTKRLGMLEARASRSAPIEWIRQRAVLRPQCGNGLLCEAASLGVCFDTLPDLSSETFLCVCPLHSRQEAGKSTLPSSPSPQQQPQWQSSEETVVARGSDFVIRQSRQRAVYLLLSVSVPRPVAAIQENAVADCTVTLGPVFFITNCLGVPIHVTLMTQTVREGKKLGLFDLTPESYVFHAVASININPGEKYGVTEVDPVSEVRMDVSLTQSNGGSIGRSSTLKSQPQYQPALIYSPRKHKRCNKQLTLVDDVHGRSTLLVNLSYSQYEVTLWSSFWIVNETPHLLQLCDYLADPCIPIAGLGIQKDDGVPPSATVPFMYGSGRAHKQDDKTVLHVRVAHEYPVSGSPTKGSRAGALQWSNWSAALPVAAIQECSIVTCALTQTMLSTLAYSVEFGSGNVASTRVITFRPRWVLLNRTAYPLAIRQILMSASAGAPVSAASGDVVQSGGVLVKDLMLPVAEAEGPEDHGSRGKDGRGISSAAVRMQVRYLPNTEDGSTAAAPVGGSDQMVTHCPWSSDFRIDTVGDQTFNVQYEGLVRMADYWPQDHAGLEPSVLPPLQPESIVDRKGELFVRRLETDVLHVSCYHSSGITYVALTNAEYPPYVIENRTEYMVFVKQRAPSDGRGVTAQGATAVYPKTTKQYTWESPSHEPVMVLWASNGHAHASTSAAGKAASPPSQAAVVPASCCVQVSFDPRHVVLHPEQLQQEIDLYDDPAAIPSAGGAKVGKMLFVRVRGAHSTSYAISIAEESAVDAYRTLPYQQWLFHAQLKGLYALLLLPTDGDAVSSSDAVALLTAKPLELGFAQGGVSADGSTGAVRDVQRFDAHVETLQLDDERLAAKEKVVMQLVDSSPTYLRWERQLFRTTPLLYCPSVSAALAPVELHVEDTFISAFTQYAETMTQAWQESRNSSATPLTVGSVASLTSRATTAKVKKDIVARLHALVLSAAGTASGGAGPLTEFHWLHKALTNAANVPASSSTSTEVDSQSPTNTEQPRELQRTAARKTAKKHVWYVRTALIDRLTLEKVNVTVSLYRSPGAADDPLRKHLGVMCLFIRSVKEARLDWHRVEQRGVCDVIWMLADLYYDAYRARLQDQLPNLVHIVGLDTMRGFVSDLLGEYFSLAGDDSESHGGHGRRGSNSGAAGKARGPVALTKPRVGRRRQAGFALDAQSTSGTAKSAVSAPVMLFGTRPVPSAPSGATAAAPSRSVTVNGASVRISDLASHRDWPTFTRMASAEETRQYAGLALRTLLRRSQRVPTLDVLRDCQPADGVVRAAAQKLRNTPQTSAGVPAADPALCTRCAEVEAMLNLQRAGCADATDTVASPQLFHPRDGSLTWAEYLHHISPSEFFAECTDEEVMRYRDALPLSVVGAPMNVLRLTGR